MALVWVNGRFVAGEEGCLSALDRGLTLADGVFETIRAHGARPLWLEEHLARLRAGAGCLGIPVPLDDAAIATGLAGLLAVGGNERSVVRLTLTRGPSAVRGLWPSADPPRPTLLATAWPLPPPRPPLRLVVARGTRRNEHSPLCGIKSLNYGDNLLARREAAQSGADDALMLNTAGRVACATVANVFFRIAGRIVTPPLAEGALPGLARARLRERLDVDERPVAEAELDRADAGFVSNSLGIAWLRAIAGRELGEWSLPAILDLYG